MPNSRNPAARTEQRVVGDVPFAVDLHLALVRASEEALHANTKSVARWGLTAQQYNALRILYFSEQAGMRLSEIGDALVQRVPDVSRLVDRLERAGLVRRRPDPADGRAALVELTAEGRSLLEEMDVEFINAHERWYSALTPAEQRRLESLLRKVAATVAATSEDGPSPDRPVRKGRR